MSIQAGVPSEHTCLVLMLTGKKKKKKKKEPESFFLKQVYTPFHRLSFEYEKNSCFSNMLVQRQFLKQVSSKLNLEKMEELDGQKFIFLGMLGVGFGDLTGTADNIPPGMKVRKADATELLVMATTSLFGRLADRFCCMCLIKACTSMNDQCAVVCTQLCAALSCVECLGCCIELCECDCDCL